MKLSMIVGSVLTASVLAGCLTVSQAPHLELKVYAIDLETKELGNRPEITVHAQIGNIGRRPTVLPTKGIGPIVNGNFGQMDVQFRDAQMGIDGFDLALSISQVDPVELRPGEAILLSHTFQKPSPVSVRVSYQVSKQFAERYGFWHGELKAKPISLK